MLITKVTALRAYNFPSQLLVTKEERTNSNIHQAGCLNLHVIPKENNKKNYQSQASQATSLEVAYHLNLKMMSYIG